MSEMYKNPLEGQYARRGIATGRSEKLGGKGGFCGTLWAGVKTLALTPSRMRGHQVE